MISYYIIKRQINIKNKKIKNFLIKLIMFVTSGEIQRNKRLA